MSSDFFPLTPSISMSSSPKYMSCSLSYRSSPRSSLTLSRMLLKMTSTLGWATSSPEGESPDFSGRRSCCLALP